MGRRLTALAACLLVLAACGGSSNDTAAPTSADESTTAPGTDAPGADTTAPTDTTAGPNEETTVPAPPPTTTIPVVKVTLVGAVVGGNSGGIGEGQTDTYSDTVMEDGDGDDSPSEGDTCRGWGDPDRNGAWTQALREGAEVKVLDAADGRQVGVGTLGVGRPSNLDPGENQWQCSLSFDIPEVEEAEAYLLQVDGLGPWAAVPNPAKPGELIVTVLTASAKQIEQCQSAELPEEIFEVPEVYGRYWSLAFRSLCDAGFRIANIRRRCHPASLATGAVLTVVDANDANRVYLDSGGPQLDPVPEPGTPVVVTLSSAVPCG
jgi:hypothetical protein